MKLSHFFLPHPHTHKKAHLISWQALLVYLLLFVSLNFGFNLITQIKPGVLGITSNIAQPQLIELTNRERAKFNLPPLSENLKLDQAAQAKAKNMFEEDYWAHYSPTGKDPWGFMISVGYKFRFAGENLARNFYNSPEVVEAWMASPSHKENIINPRYSEIGMAVVEGVLKGQRTTLVVQMFGTPVEAVAVVPSLNNSSSLITQNNPNVKNSATEDLSTLSLPTSTISQKPVIDPYFTLKAVGFGLIMIIASLIVADLYVVKRRGVIRLSSRHLPHLALLGIGASALLSISPGSIL